MPSIPGKYKKGQLKPFIQSHVTLLMKTLGKEQEINYPMALAFVAPYFPKRDIRRAVSNALRNNERNKKLQRIGKMKNWTTRGRTPSLFIIV